MRTIISFFICLMFVFTSCKYEDYQTEKIQSTEEKQIIIEKDKYSFPMDLIEFSYKNHEYLYFEYGHEMIIIHNPDCHCYKQSIETIENIQK